MNKEVENVLPIRIYPNVMMIAKGEIEFQSMLNNAIDHSKTEKIKISFVIEQDKVWFSIRDTGIGIFNNIRKKFEPLVIPMLWNLPKPFNT